MTDRELLELAAKAAGIKLADPVNSHIPSGGVWIVTERSNRDRVWDPLNNDGDALRLLNRLGMQLRFVQIDPVEIGTGRVVIELQWAPGGIKNRISKVVEAGESPDKLMRVAITRAAAEIGRAMQ